MTEASYLFLLAAVDALCAAQPQARHSRGPESTWLLRTPDHINATHLGAGSAHGTGGMERLVSVKSDSFVTGAEVSPVSDDKYGRRPSYT